MYHQGWMTKMSGAISLCNDRKWKSLTTPIILPFPSANGRSQENCFPIGDSSPINLTAVSFKIKLCQTSVWKSLEKNLPWAISTSNIFWKSKSTEWIARVMFSVFCFPSQLTWLVAKPPRKEKFVCATDRISGYFSNSCLIVSYLS